MDPFEDEEFEEDFQITKKEQKIKQEILDENFKKASTTINNTKKENIKKPIKKPFFKLGFCLILISIFCLILLNLVPWAYIKYDNKISESKNNEFFYNNNGEIETSSNDTNFTNFFKSEGSYESIGISSYDLTKTSKVQSYIFYAFIAIGIVFTIFQIIFRKRDFSIKKYRLFHAFFALITAILSIYFIFISVKFMGANILIGYNIQNVLGNLEKLVVVFITPVVLIFIVSGILKIAIAVLKINFNEFEKILDEKTTKNSSKIIRHGVKLR
jgi:hypothetical protein